jgi:hypothetical protein
LARKSPKLQRRRQRRVRSLRLLGVTLGARAGSFQGGADCRATKVVGAEQSCIQERSAAMDRAWVHRVVQWRRALRSTILNADFQGGQRKRADSDCSSLDRRVGSGRRSAGARTAISPRHQRGHGRRNLQRQTCGCRDRTVVRRHVGRRYGYTAHARHSRAHCLQRRSQRASRRSLPGGRG